MVVKKYLHLEVDNSLKKRIDKAADAAGMRVSTYVRLVMDQATRTPFRLKHRKTA